jgi:hypothetical protein
MHREVTEREADAMVAAFHLDHADHPTAQMNRGTYGLVLSCPECGLWESAEIDNAARSRALGLKREVARELMAEQRVS